MRKPVARALEMTGIHSVFMKKPLVAWSVSERTKLPKKPPVAMRMTQRAHSTVRAATMRLRMSRKPRPA